MTFLHAVRRAPAALVVAVLAGTLVPRTAHATSCGPVEVDFIVPWTSGSLDDGDGPLLAGGPVPVDVRPRVALRADSCEGIDPTARITITGADGAEVAGEPVTIQSSRGTILELIVEARLELGVQHEMCVGTYGCIRFATSEAIDQPPPVPQLSLNEPFFTEDDDSVSTDVVGQASWEPFLGAVWLELRDDRPSLVAAVVERDAASRAEGSAGLTRLFRVGDEACVVAVARAANGAIAESEPSCFTVEEPEGGCAIGGVPGRPAGRGLAAGIALVGAAVLLDRRRRR